MHLNSKKYNYIIVIHSLRPFLVINMWLIPQWFFRFQRSSNVLYVELLLFFHYTIQIAFTKLKIYRLKTNLHQAIDFHSVWALPDELLAIDHKTLRANSQTNLGFGLWSTSQHTPAPSILPYATVVHCKSIFHPSQANEELDYADLTAPCGTAVSITICHCRKHCPHQVKGFHKFIHLVQAWIIGDDIWYRTWQFDLIWLIL